MKIPPYRSLLIACVAGVSLAGAHAQEVHSIKFSDPGKPGTLKIHLGRGELHVEGTDASEISVRSSAKSVNSKPRKDGLREISAASSFALTEKDNVVILDAATHNSGRSGNADFQITVPRTTTVVVQNAWGGDITCSSLSGDIEINSMHGEVRLDDVSGGVVVLTMNGEIHASVRQLQESKPLSFNSMNGEVVLRVPENAKANVRFRTQNGSVLTDFEDSALVTKTEPSVAIARNRGFLTLRNGAKVLSADIQDGIREATQVSATAVREALEAVKEGLEAARLDQEEARRQVDNARRQLERARSQADQTRQATELEQWRIPKPATSPDAPLPPRAAVPPKGAMPTISGGKLVTGTLNGGGPEISIATMNGDVVLRKLQPQP